MARPRTHDDAVRARLLEAASRAVSEGGSANVSLRVVAAAAGTTTAAVYSLFGSREGLVDAVVEEGFRRFAAHLGAAATGGEPHADLLALGLAYRQSALDDPHFYRVMFTVSPRTTAAGTEAGTDAGTDADADADARSFDADDGGPVADNRTVPAEPTFEVLRTAAARVLRAEGRDEHGADELALRAWSLAHGLVSLELAGLLPGTPAEREQRYVAALRSMGTNV